MFTYCKKVCTTVKRNLGSGEEEMIHCKTKLRLIEASLLSFSVFIKFVPGEA